jgi:type II secretory pathway predicted ATPase ExeA
MKFDEKQLQAIKLCGDLSKRIVAITGEAGTGKTTIIREVYKNFINYIHENKSYTKWVKG